MRDIPLLVPDWPAPANVRAASTLRAGGMSEGAFASLNLGLHVGDSPETVQANRRRLRAKLGLAEEPAWLQQVHGNDVVEAAAGEVNAVADAAWTGEANVACVVMTADCLPVLFCDRQGRRVAAAHGGWRSLAGGILERTVAAMGCRPAELMAWLGPAIGPGNFEVGPEVREAFVSRWPQAGPSFSRGQDDRWLCDIYALASVQLEALGVTGIYGGGECTVADSARFFSYRRDGRTGRMASLIWLDASAVAE